METVSPGLTTPEGGKTTKGRSVISHGDAAGSEPCLFAGLGGAGRCRADMASLRMRRDCASTSAVISSQSPCLAARTRLRDLSSTEAAFNLACSSSAWRLMISAPDPQSVVAAGRGVLAGRNEEARVRRTSSASLAAASRRRR